MKFGRWPRGLVQPYDRADIRAGGKPPSAYGMLPRIEAG
jgi:hypothetical protein